MGSLKLGCSAERMAQALLGRWTTRLRLAQLCNATGNLLQGGVNDIVLGDVTTLQQMKDNIVAIQALVAPYTPNAPWLGGTLTPRTTSSDTFDTATNQTPQTNYSPLGNSLREFYNDVLTGGQSYFKASLMSAALSSHPHAAVPGSARPIRLAGRSAISCRMARM